MSSLILSTFVNVHGSHTSPATPGFDIDCHGKLTHKGSEIFHACPVNDHGEWNIYKEAVRGQAKCVKVTITATGASGIAPGCKSPPSPPTPPTPTYGKNGCDDKNKCGSPVPPSPTSMGYPSKSYCADKDKHQCGSPSSTTPAPRPTYGDTCGKGKCTPSSTTTTTPTPKPTYPTPCGKGKGKCAPSSTTTPTPKPTESHCHNGYGNCHHHPNSCPVNLDGDFEFPHLIVPVDRSKPNKALGNKFNGTVSSTVCTTYNFDVHERLAGKTCSLVFLFPFQSELETSSFLFNGTGKLIFSKLDKPVTHDTTWNNKPYAYESVAGSIHPGEDVLVFSAKCPAGKRVGAQICGTGVELEYFQDFNPSPIGLYIRAC